jgi:uncharacterized protein (DUF433 family)
MMIPTVEPVPLLMDDGGVIRVGGTRVTLDIVIEKHLEGVSAERIVEKYPALSLADVYAAISYYLRHQEEVETYMAEQRQRAAEMQRKLEGLFDPTELKARLLAKKQLG